MLNSYGILLQCLFVHLNATQHWVKYGQTKYGLFSANSWVKCLTQPSGQRGVLYLTHHFLECTFENFWLHGVLMYGEKMIYIIKNEY